MTRKIALLLNFTAPVYHWGCYGTSTEAHDTLSERGYLVNWLDVRTTHTLEPTPRRLEDFNSGQHLKEFFGRNKFLYHALGDADVVVVNGEGTLHRLHEAPLNLLYVMHLAQNALRKPVHLINHSVFPGGTLAPDPAADPIYATVLSRLTHVVPREDASAALLERLGVRVTQGFDCLPRFIARHAGSLTTTRGAAGVLLSGGVSQSGEEAREVARGVARALPSDVAVQFLTGAKSRPAAEDRTCFESMRSVLPQLEWCEARSMEAWLAAIAGAGCLVSARFHHTIAAATLGTPVVVLPSNTPKTGAVCSMLGLPAPLDPLAPDLSGRVANALAAALGGSGARVSEQTKAHVLELAAQNFHGL